MTVKKQWTPADPIEHVFEEHKIRFVHDDVQDQYAALWVAEDVCKALQIEYEFKRCDRYDPDEVTFYPVKVGNSYTQMQMLKPLGMLRLSFTEERSWVAQLFRDWLIYAMFPIVLYRCGKEKSVPKPERQEPLPALLKEIEEAFLADMAKPHGPANNTAHKFWPRLQQALAGKSPFQFYCKTSRASGVYKRRDTSVVGSC